MIRFSVIAALLAASLFGLSKLEVTQDASEAMLPSNSLGATLYERYLENFPSDLTALIVFEDLICSPSGWESFTDIEKAISSQNWVDRTLSLASPISKYAIERDSFVQFDAFSETEFDDSEARCKAAIAYPPFSKNFISPNGQAAALYVIAKQNVDAVFIKNSLKGILSLHTNPEEQQRVYLTGEPIVSAEVSLAVSEDSTLIGILAFIMLVATIVVTKSKEAGLAAFLLIIFVLALTFGFMGLMGIKITPSTSLVIFLLVPLASAFVIHAHGYALRTEPGITIATKANRAYIFATLSTAIGFLCTGFTPAEDIQKLSITGVFGISVMYAGIHLIVFPLMQYKKPKSTGLRIPFPMYVITKPWLGWATLFLLTTLTIFGLSRLTIDYNPTNYLPNTNPAKQAFDNASHHFGRMYLPVVIETDSTLDPSFWRDLENLEKNLEKEFPTGFHSLSLKDSLRELNSTLADGSDLPSNSEGIAQLLLWYDTSDLDLFLNEQTNQSVLYLQVPFTGSKEYLRLKTAIRENSDQLDSLTAIPTGRVASFFETGHRIGYDTLRGLSIAVAIIFLLLLYLFKSISFATIGIVVNTVPVLFGLGLLGLLEIPLDLGSSIVAAMAFGVVLDDSTHLLVRIQQLTASGYDPNTAVTVSMEELISPICATTVAIAAGFIVLYFAEIQLFGDFATVMSTTLLTALAVDAWVLPVLVRRFFKDPVDA